MLGRRLGIVRPDRRVPELHPRRVDTAGVAGGFEPSERARRRIRRLPHFSAAAQQAREETERERLALRVSRLPMQRKAVVHAGQRLVDPADLRHVSAVVHQDFRARPAIAHPGGRRQGLARERERPVVAAQIGIERRGLAQRARQRVGAPRLLEHRDRPVGVCERRAGVAHAERDDFQIHQAAGEVRRGTCRLEQGQCRLHRGPRLGERAGVGVQPSDIGEDHRLEASVARGKRTGFAEARQRTGAIADFGQTASERDEQAGARTRRERATRPLEHACEHRSGFGGLARFLERDGPGEQIPQAFLRFQVLGKRVARRGWHRRGAPSYPYPDPHR